MFLLNPRNLDILRSLIELENWRIYKKGKTANILQTLYGIVAKHITKDIPNHNTKIRPLGCEHCLENTFVLFIRIEDVLFKFISLASIFRLKDYLCFETQIKQYPKTHPYCK